MKGKCWHKYGSITFEYKNRGLINSWKIKNPTNSQVKDKIIWKLCEVEELSTVSLADPRVDSLADSCVDSLADSDSGWILPMRSWSLWNSQWKVCIFEILYFLLYIIVFQ